MAFVFVILFFAAIVGIFRPYKFLQNSKRWHYGLATLISFIAIRITAPDQPQDKDQSAQKENTKDTADSREAKATAKAASTTSKSATAKADIISLWSSVKSESASCDKANSNIANALGSLGKSTSIYAAYELADNAHSICRDSWSAMNELEVPNSIEGDDADQLQKTLDNCAGAYLLRQMSLDKLKTILNGDMRPSAMQEFKGDAQAAQGGVMACVAGMMGAGVKAGADMKDFN